MAQLDTRVGTASGPGLPPASTARPLTLLVIGATRGTGRQVLEQALAAGHPVVALARDPARIELPHDASPEQLSVVRGDVLDAESLASAMAGCDAVISTIGVASRGPTTLYSAGMRNIIQAMHRAGVRRLIAVSASPLSDGTGDTWLFRRLLMPLTRAAFGSTYADMAIMEDEMRRSDLDWTIVRPPRLTNKPRTGSYRMVWNRRVPGGLTISRADLADAILKLLADPQSVHAAVDIGY